LKYQSRKVYFEYSPVFESYGELYYNITSLFSAFPEAGWYTPWNGYQYRVTNTKSSWHTSRGECQRYGGDLAVIGMRNTAIRR